MTLRNTVEGTRYINAVDEVQAGDRGILQTDRDCRLQTDIGDDRRRLQTTDGDCRRISADGQSQKFGWVRILRLISAVFDSIYVHSMIFRKFKGTEYMNVVEEAYMQTTDGDWRRRIRADETRTEVRQPLALFNI